MGEVVNLRTQRKRKARAGREQEAERNRAAFGRPKAEREAAARQETLQLRRLDGHRRDPGARSGEGDA